MKLVIYFIIKQFVIFNDWGLGIGDWGLGIGSASNNYLLSILPRFKKIYRYNKRAETHFTKSYQDLNNSIVESEHRDQFYTVGNANKLNVAKRINEYKSYLKHFDN